MKKIMYISDGISQKKYNHLSNKFGVFPKQQMQRYNKTFLTGLSSLDFLKVKAFSCVPFSSPKLITFYKSDYEDSCEYHYIPSSNNRIIRSILNLVCSFFYVLFLCEDTIIIDVLNISINKGAIIAGKIKRLHVCGLVTDIPEFLNISESIKNHMNRNIALCDSYIVLSEKMNDKINPNNKPFVTIEGQIDDNNIRKIEKGEKNSLNTIIYAGSLDKTNGIDYFIDGFLHANLQNCSLVIYGNGNYSDKIKEIVSKNNNIIFKGQVSNEELLPELRKATLLVNPRPTNQDFSLYSFPSKNMEYMASGTALLTTHIPSMPDEYLPYVYILEDESVQGVAKILIELLALSPDELYEKGLSAQKFVFENKTGKKQAEKIVNSLFN